MTLIDKINAFEAGNETVAEFNATFSVPLTGFSNNDIVTIGECCSPETRRVLTVTSPEFSGSEVFEYDFAKRIENV